MIIQQSEVLGEIEEVTRGYAYYVETGEDPPDWPTVDVYDQDGLFGGRYYIESEWTTNITKSRSQKSNISNLCYQQQITNDKWNNITSRNYMLAKHLPAKPLICTLDRSDDDR